MGGDRLGQEHFFGFDTYLSFGLGSFFWGQALHSNSSIMGFVYLGMG